MSSFAPAAVLTLHHFEVSENGRGYWVAKDKEGLIGGVFRTQKDALRFALFEAAGDSTCVKVISSPEHRSELQKREVGCSVRPTRSRSRSHSLPRPSHT
jgi:hypothetical protein